VTQAEQAVEEWLLIEWPEDEAEPTKYGCPPCPPISASTPWSIRAKLRWRIERDYQKLKQDLRLGHYGTVGAGCTITSRCGIAAYGFLIAERAIFPPPDPETIADPRRLPFTPVTDPAAPPLRPERHVANSIATMRRRAILALVERLPRCGRVTGGGGLFVAARLEGIAHLHPKPDEPEPTRL
jgi:hypothetical protein